LSSRLVGALADEFPNSCHVNLAGLASATDLEIWAYAREHDFAVVSKDDDFRSLSLVNGAPPRVIWLRIGNASTAAIEAFIRSALVKISRSGHSRFPRRNPYSFCPSVLS
jgi:predicted nuclease of predicted toxin-antitoxin system